MSIGCRVPVYIPAKCLCNTGIVILDHAPFIVIIKYHINYFMINNYSMIPIDMEIMHVALLLQIIVE